MTPIQDIEPLRVYFNDEVGGSRQVTRFHNAADTLVRKSNCDDALIVRLQRHIRTFHFECNPGTTIMSAGYKRRLKDFFIHLQTNDDKYDFNETARWFNDIRYNTNTRDEYVPIPMPMRDPALVRVATLKLQNRELMEDVRRQMTLKKGFRREWQKRGRELTDAHATIETATQEKLMSDYKLQEMQNTLDAERVASSQLRAEHSELKRHLLTTLKKGFRREWQKREWQKRGRELTDAHATIETATQEKLMSDYKLQEMQKSLDAERVASSQLRAEHSELKRHLRLLGLRLLGRAPPPAPPPAPLPQTGDAEPSAKRTRTGL